MRHFINQKINFKTKEIIMKYLHEYRDQEVAQSFIEQIHKTATRSWNVMEVCGGQTHSLVKNGLLDALAPKVNMIHGPGCPVCVSPKSIIDKAIFLVEQNVVMCSFGDMLRVPGNKGTLLEAKAKGGDIRILYSPLEAVQMAKQEPQKEFCFLAVGFETTGPANALAVLHAHRQNVRNFSILVNHVLVPPAIEAIEADPLCQIDGYLGAGHVCAIMGTSQYKVLVNKIQKPIVITGFEPLDLLQGILMTVVQLEKGEKNLENQYTRIVPEEGNIEAIKTVNMVFEETDCEWRGIGMIPQSGWKLKSEWKDFDAEKRMSMSMDVKSYENELCIAGDILKGIKKPNECKSFRSTCTPLTPQGAPMHDGAFLELTGSVAFSTDSYVIHPIFFPNSNIGELAVNGTINDLAMCGAEAKYLSLSFIIEEGLTIQEFYEILFSVKDACDRGQVKIVTGDTKVVERGKGDKIYINTSGIGVIHPKAQIDIKQIQNDDCIIVSGEIAAHGISILSLRQGLTFESDIISDTKSLKQNVMNTLNEFGSEIKWLRDATRGGLATVLNELVEGVQCGIEIKKATIPINEQVTSGCELLGLDPLFVANEGVYVLVVSKTSAERVLAYLKCHEESKKASIIGYFNKNQPKKVMMSGTMGGKRIISMLPGDQLPRIC
ncbi:hypothetical protein CHS0354_000687 [Potamilus streckersoni]|uniref:Hydrogenase expression/formation protein n=1 Tax=Potamilus streckersoni TaxID=2493646 RepID=A0AAE0T728_9BIVA|nr:hypothetical protein CHS0354_000687 [Potamilus streckersoni]